MLVSGPNLNLLGEREPAVYGTDTLADHVARAEKTAARHGLELQHVQSNHEGDLIEAVHGARGRADALVINAGALSHTSWSLHDAVAAFDGPDGVEPVRGVARPDVVATLTGMGAHR